MHGDVNVSPNSCYGLWILGTRRNQPSQNSHAESATGGKSGTNAIQTEATLAHTQPGKDGTDRPGQSSHKEGSSSNFKAMDSSSPSSQQPLIITAGASTPNALKSSKRPSTVKHRVGKSWTSMGYFDKELMHPHTSKRKKTKEITNGRDAFPMGDL